jgi:hypothetical protein
MSTQITISPEIKLVVNTTPITGGSAGQILFQTTGNTVGESANLFWDNTNKIFKVATGTNGIVLEGDAGGYPTFKINTLRSGTDRRNWMFATEQINIGDFVFFRSATGGGNASTLVYSIFNDGNFGLNTSTNAGFKLDVNGTARALNNLIVYGDGTSAATRATLTIQSLGETFSGRLVFSRNNSNWYSQIETIGSGGGVNLGLAINDNGAYSLVTNKGKVFIGNSLTIPTTSTLQVGGAGNTSATTSLLVQQSTGVNVLSVRDDMYVTVQNTNNSECFQVRGANDDATIRFTPSGGTSNIVLRSQSSFITLSTTANSFGDLRVSGGGQTLRIGTSSASGGGLNYYSSINGAIHSHRWFQNNIQLMRLATTGNLLINTDIDSGFKLDVEGTARVSGNLTVNAGRIDLTNNFNLRVTNQFGTLLNGMKGNSTGQIEIGDGNTEAVQIATSFLLVNTATKIQSSVCTLQSTTQGFLPPRMTNAQMVAITTPAEGLVVYDLTNKKLCCYDGATWQNLF